MIDLNEQKPDIVKRIIDAYALVKTSDAPLMDHSLSGMFDFVITSLECQSREAREDWVNKNWEHLAKELADHVLVAVDWLYRLGYDPYKVIDDRCEENRKKIMSGTFNMKSRGLEFYQTKALDGIPYYLRHLVKDEKSETTELGSGHGA